MTWRRATNRPSVQPPHNPTAEPAWEQRIAGVDEAGRGPWAGPVVAAAVVLRKERLAVRIDDSKRLSPRQRSLACAVILQEADVGIGIVDAQSIDRLNILRAALLAMRQALESLPWPPQQALIDGLHVPETAIPCTPIVGGDRLNYSISCASIVAKVVRDELMVFYHTLFPEYRFDLHKGYGAPAHRESLARLGPCAIHRFSFQPVAACLMRSMEAADAVMAAGV